MIAGMPWYVLLTGIFGGCGLGMALVATACAISAPRMPAPEPPWMRDLRRECHYDGLTSPDDAEIL